MCIKIPLCLKCGVPHIPSEIENRVREGDVVDVEIIYPSGVAGNVLRWGTGALNIDGCRIATNESLARPFGSGGIGAAQLVAERGTITGQNLTGRWPANLCLSWPADEYQLRDDVTTEQKRELYAWLAENAQ